MKHALLLATLALTLTGVAAKLPAPSDDAKAKAAEAAAKTAHGNKVADYQLCQAMDKVAARYQADARKAGKDPKPPASTPACTDPGAFVPPTAASGAAPTAAVAPSAAPAPASAVAAALPAKR